MPPNHFESEVESFLEGSHGDRTHNKQQADHHTVTPLCGTLLDEATVRGSHSGPHEIGTEVEMGAVAGARGPG